MHSAHSEWRQSLQGPPPVVDDYKKLSWTLSVGGAAPPIYVGLSEKWAKFQALNTFMRNFIEKRRMTADHSSARHCNEETPWHSANSQSRHSYFSSTRHCTLYKRQAGFRWGKVLLSRRHTFTSYAVEISKNIKKCSLKADELHQSGIRSGCALSGRPTYKETAAIFKGAQRKLNWKMLLHEFKVRNERKTFQIVLTGTYTWMRHRYNRSLFSGRHQLR